MEGSGLKFRVVKTAGASLKGQLQRSNPFLSKECGRDKCFKCQTGGKGNCRTSGVVYTISCVDCETVGKTVMYIGQTARSGFARGKEHLTQLESRRADDSRMYGHAEEVHGGVIPSVRMDIVSNYGNDTMSRQIAEAVLIRSSKPEHLLNLKTEYNMNILPHVNLSNSP